MRTLIVGIGAAVVAGAVLAACVPPPSTGAGRADYETFCAACHGSSGRGDGRVGRDLVPPPADLTRLSADNGGTFPLVAVMAKIDGYTRATEAMPEFGAILQGETVFVETAPGVMTPTPARLVELARYVETLQR
jgi:mono/diheme cytochrome c family protein